MSRERSSDELRQCLAKLQEVQTVLDQHHVPASVTANLDLAIQKLKEATLPRA